MSLDTVLDSMVGVLKQQLTELVTVELAGGRVDLKEIKRRSLHLPGAFVLCTATRDGRWAFGKFSTTAFFMVVVAAKSHREGQPVAQDRAHNIARLLTRALTTVAAAGTWGDAEVTSSPDKVASMNPYSTAADEAGLALWGITWEQQLELVKQPLPAELPPLTAIATDWKMVESTQPLDAQDLLKTDEP